MFLWAHECAAWLKQEVCCGLNRQRTGNVMVTQLSALQPLLTSSNHKSSLNSVFNRIIDTRTGDSKQLWNLYGEEGGVAWRQSTILTGKPTKFGAASCTLRVTMLRLSRVLLERLRACTEASARNRHWRKIAELSVKFSSTKAAPRFRRMDYQVKHAMRPYVIRLYVNY